MVAAEQCRVLGQKAAAIEFYDKAILGAKTYEYLQEEGVANELAAKFYLDWGKEKVAAGYMQEAYYCYAKWGAKAKVTDLERRYPQLLQPILQQYKISFAPLETLISVTNSATEPSNSSISDSLDFASIIKAAQAISSTIQLDQLLQQLTHIILQSSGGDECLLIMPQEGIWEVQAIANLETTELCCQPIESHSHLPLKLIQYVKNTQSVVVIDNLQTDLPVIDAYLLQTSPQSILCLPILNQGHLVGLLYLKNQFSAGVFNSDRMTVINFLCTQAAISLENARLYHQSQKTLLEVQQVEQQLQASQKFLQLVIDNIPQLVFWKDTQSVYLGCNRLFAEVAGLNSVQDIIGKTDYELPWKKEESDFYRECDRRIMDSGIPKIGIIETQQQAGGKQTWAETNKIPLQDDNGTIIGILGTYQDISDRKQAEAEKSRLISILEATSDLVGIADINGNNLYLNQAGQELLQIPASEINKFHISETTAPAMLSMLETEMLPKALRDGIWSGETILLSRSGEEIPASQVLMTHKNAQGEVEFLSTIIRDIRDSKRIEAEYKRKSEALEQALEELQNTQIQLIQNEKMSALGNLVAGVAHEINNPVGFLNGNIKPALDYISDLFGLLDLVQTKYSQLHPEVQEEIENIDLDFIREDLPKLIASMEEGVKRITDISTSLRTFSRADTNHPVACNIHNGIDSTIMILKHRLKANTTRPEITVIKDYGDLPQIQCYAGQLNQVFMNILANAIDALDEASIGRKYKNINNKITIKTALSTDNQQVIIHIQDNGKGMTSEIKQKIFDNLFTTKAVNKGTGLGLAIARQIVVEKHQGQITVNSTPNQGTEFIITLPL
ncbi:ATP-binding protein [Dolichospermum sp. UHCC 0259]|uniref:ATP-binding protein n=1 Tax=Dolichospermum sp. UHCC 0259 TaxID=2590010 RepID=UPI001C2DE2FD